MMNFGPQKIKNSKILLDSKMSLSTNQFSKVIFTAKDFTPNSISHNFFPVTKILNRLS